MNTVFLPLPGNETLARSLAERCKGAIADCVIRHFPDGETYVRINSDIKGKKVILVCTLDYPDEKLLPLYYLARTATDLGASRITMVAPYLSYMRQDKRFREGEGLTSAYFARLISFFADELITVDPHLHRTKSLDEIYSIPAKVLHASALISEWIRTQVSRPVLIGPDSESAQWVSEIAEKAGAPWVALQKKREGDKEVEISMPHLEKFKGHTPVLADDIISTGRTLIETINQLKKMGMKPPVCIGIHGIFAGSAYADLQRAGAERIITCNTVPHESNAIDVSGILANALGGKG